MESFYQYCASFYHPAHNAIYPFEGLTMDDIVSATTIHLATSTIPFEGDSIDREQVAQILVNDFGYSYPPASIKL
jgi:hypothetical protein